jgi:hypothetical protein
MLIAKHQVFELINELPDEIDSDEIIYRFYLIKKLGNTIR